MANAYGIVHQYGEPQSTFDSELAISVLQQKQGQFDANQQKIDQTLSQMGLQASMIKNDDARQYLNDRVNKVIQETQSLRTSDIGSRDSTRKIISTISSALDDKAIKHIGYGQQIDNFKSSVQSIMDESPEKYSNINYQDAVNSAGLEEYLNGDADSDLSGLSYTPYVDLNAELVSKVKAAKEIMGSQTIKVEDPENPGEMLETTYDNLTVGQWIQVMPQMITPQMDKQFEIEGRAMFQWDKAKLIKYKTEAINAEKDVLQKEVDRFENLLKTDELDETFAAKYRKNVVTLNKSIAELSQEEMNQDYDMTSIGKKLRRSQIMHSVASIAGSDPSQEMSFDKDLAERTSARTMDQLSSNVQGTTVSDTGTGDLEVLTDVDFRNSAREKEQTYNSSLSAGIATFSEGLKKETEALTQSYIDDGLSQTEASFKAFEQKAKQANSAESLNALDQTRRARSQYRMQNEVDKKSYAQAGQEQWSDNITKIFKSLTEKGMFDQTMIITADGRTIHSKDYLEEKGITTEEGLLAFVKSEEGADLKGQVLADVALSEKNTTLDLSVSNIGSALSGQFASRFSKEDLHNIKGLMSNFGEDMDITDLLTISIPKSVLTPEDNENESNFEEIDEGYLLDHLGDVVEKYRIELNPEAKGTKTYKALQKRLKVNNYGNDVNQVSEGLNTFTDQSFYDDSDIKSIFSRSNIISKVDTLRRENQVQINAPKKFTIDPPLKPSEPSVDWLGINRLRSSKDSEGFLELDFKMPVEVYKDPKDPNTYIIGQLNIEEKANYDKKKIQSLSAYKEVRVDAVQFRQAMPRLASVIDEQQVAGELNFNANFEDTQSSLSYPKGKDRESVVSYTKFFDFNPDLADLATEDGAAEILRQSLPEEQAEMYMEVFEKVFKNSNKFSVKYKKKEGQQYAKIFMKNKKSQGGEEQIGSLDLSGMSQEQVGKTFNVAPQVFLSQYLQIMASDIKRNEGYPTKRLRDFMTTLNQL